MLCSTSASNPKIHTICVSKRQTSVASGRYRSRFCNQSACMPTYCLDHEPLPNCTTTTRDYCIESDFQISLSGFELSWPFFFISVRLVSWTVFQFTAKGTIYEMTRSDTKQIQMPNEKCPMT